MTNSTPRQPVQFPSVSGSNLAKRPFQLPGDFEGVYNLVLIAFKQHQQRDVNIWLPLAQRLASMDSRWRYYELPVIRDVNFLYRAFIDGGMRSGIPDQTARETTITLYLDKEAFRRALDLPHEDTIYVLVVRPDGVVLWQTSGACTDEKAQALATAVSHLTGTAVVPTTP